MKESRSCKLATSSGPEESIPLYYGEWKIRVCVVILAGLNLAKSHRVAVPGHSVCGLDIFRERYCHKSIYNFIKETKTGVFVQGISNLAGRRAWL